MQMLWMPPLVLLKILAYRNEIDKNICWTKLNLKLLNEHFNLWVRLSATSALYPTRNHLTLLVTELSCCPQTHCSLEARHQFKVQGVTSNTIQIQHSPWMMTDWKPALSLWVFRWWYLKYSIHGLAAPITAQMNLCRRITTSVQNPADMQTCRDIHDLHKVTVSLFQSKKVHAKQSFAS